MGKKVSEILKRVFIHSVSGCDGVVVDGINYNSKKVKRGDIFVAIRGEKFDGNDFIEDAVRRGAVSILSERKRMLQNICWLQSEDVRKNMAEISNFIFDYPSEKLFTAGITGTNGKTTIAYLLHHIFSKVGIEHGMTSTVENISPARTETSIMTTPESPDIVKLMYETVMEGGEAFFLEVSSHSIDFKRVWGILFDVAVFTNLTRDHLDFYENMENYFASKLKLFVDYSPKNVVVNVDSQYGRRIFEVASGNKYSYGFSEDAGYKITDFKSSHEGIFFKVKDIKGDTFEVKSKLFGRYNALNILASLVVAKLYGIDFEDSINAIGDFNGVKGRLEFVADKNGGKVYIDYAHTPDALKEVLNSVKNISKRGRLIVLFGAGGNRDREKRPLMGRVVCELSDFAIITSDNPRNENPEDIIDEVKEGFFKDNYVVEIDRKNAIYKALDMLEPGDVLILAGKGHEDYQILKDGKIPFDERKIVFEYLEREGYETH